MRREAPASRAPPSSQVSEISLNSSSNTARILRAHLKYRYTAKVNSVHLTRFTHQIMLQDLYTMRYTIHEPTRRVSNIRSARKSADTVTCTCKHTTTPNLKSHTHSLSIRTPLRYGTLPESTSYFVTTRVTDIRVTSTVSQSYNTLYTDSVLL